MNKKQEKTPIPKFLEKLADYCEFLQSEGDKITSGASDEDTRLYEKYVMLYHKLLLIHYELIPIREQLVDKKILPPVSEE